MTNWQSRGRVEADIRVGFARFSAVRVAVFFLPLLCWISTTFFRPGINELAGFTAVTDNSGKTAEKSADFPLLKEEKTLRIVQHPPTGEKEVRDRYGVPTGPSCIDDARF
ncbi:MAG: hypothetical protein WC729_01310 [Sphingomonas sp.]|uniref:hypothetical protein n=1 Tax=Sphingomonas sp. TaxID=28214 RepID=UPI0035692DDD